MQTFLPYPDFAASARVLDNRRLGRQRVEAYQILRVLAGMSRGWTNHPAVLMWKGYETALSAYMNAMIDEWESRGFNNNMFRIALVRGFDLPLWLGDDSFHAAHRSNLLRKDPVHYRPLWPDEPDDLPYLWPTQVMTR